MGGIATKKSTAIGSGGGGSDTNGLACLLTHHVMMTITKNVALQDRFMIERPCGLKKRIGMGLLEKKSVCWCLLLFNSGYMQKQ